MSFQSTVGQLLINDNLPENYRDYDRVLDKKSLIALLTKIAKEEPEKYRETTYKLGKISTKLFAESGGYSITLEHLRTPECVKQAKKQIMDVTKQIMSDNSLKPKEKYKKITDVVIEIRKDTIDKLYKEALEKKNPAALSILSGTKGKPNNLNSLIGFDGLYEDSNRNAISFPVLNSYSAGLQPTEYLAGSFGARAGVIDVKLGIRDAGALGKQLVRAVHRNIVTAEDGEEQNEDIGLPVDTSDGDNIGALLARSVGPYKRNTIITNNILKDLESQGIEKILIRSPILGGNKDGGLYSRDVGVRETNRLPVIGENPSIPAAQTFGEQVEQASLSSKHSGGVYGFTSGAVTGFKQFSQLTDVPAQFSEGATHVEEDGKVQKIEPAVAGGYNVYVNNKKYYVYSNRKLTAKVGDELEAGDTLSDGLPNPATIVRYKGIGEGRRYFTKLLRDASNTMNMTNNRRNIELLSRGIIDHVTINDFYNQLNPGETVSYSTLAANYQPRETSKEMDTKENIKGQYLEKPVLHYTIGTQIKPSVIKTLNEFGIKRVTVNKEPPPFSPEMVSSRFNLLQDKDWVTKMYGSNLERGFLDSVASTATSDPKGTSAIPGIVLDPDFGKGKVKSLAEPLKFKPIDID